MGHTRAMVGMVTLAHQKDSSQTNLPQTQPKLEFHGSIPARGGVRSMCMLHPGPTQSWILSPVQSGLDDRVPESKPTPDLLTA